MSANDFRPNPDQKQPKRTIRDLPGCIKYIILLFLLLLFFGEYYAGEYRGFPRVSQIVWLILFIKLLLIILLLILIWVQRQLFCDITAPVGCALVVYDAAQDKWMVKVEGTASGTAFGSYTLSVSPSLAVTYPTGGGTVPVTNNELGRLDVTNQPTGLYTLTLVVSPSGWGSPCTRTVTFNYLRKTVSITQIGGVDAQEIGPHPDSPTERMKQVKPVPDPDPPAVPPNPGPEASVGGSITVQGTADYYGCNRQMSEYRLEHKSIPPSRALPWTQIDAGPWDPINPALPFADGIHSRVYTGWQGSVIDNVVASPNFLTRIWQQIWVNQDFHPFPPPFFLKAQRWVTTRQNWDTSSLNGRYTVRLRVQHQPLPPDPPDATPPALYDAATVWIDNRAIEGRITGIAVGAGSAFSACEELSLAQFITPGSPSATSIPADIRGRAWDPVIRDSYVEPLPAPHTIRPNDNFGSYALTFKKDGSIVFLEITPPGGSTTRVPNILREAPLATLVEPLPPAPPDTGSLNLWNIVKALDAGPRPDPGAVAPYPKIFRGDRCAYLIKLSVTDTTLVSESNTHAIEHDWPFCIMNDIPDSVVPNATTTPWP